MNKLLVLTTGGTIDKVYFDANSTYQVGEAVVASILRAMNVGFDFDVQAICKKDSLEITDTDRAAIKEAINRTEASHILVTHGTDSMVATAKHLQPETEKCIVICGAMQPAAFKETDAIFNIGTALGVLSVAQAGVYIAMNGRAFEPDYAVKNYQTRRFEHR